MSSQTSGATRRIPIAQSICEDAKEAPNLFPQFEQFLSRRGDAEGFFSRRHGEHGRGRMADTNRKVLLGF